MIKILAFSILTSLGTDNFEVEPQATILHYSQNSVSLTTQGSDFVGETLGGYFQTPQNWTLVGNLCLLASIGSNNPSSLFSIELYSGESLTLVGVYEGSTQSLTPNGQATPIPLTLVELGPGDPADIRGIQFTWQGEGNAIEFSMYNFVDTNPPEPLNPKSQPMDLIPLGSSSNGQEQVLDQLT